MNRFARGTLLLFVLAMLAILAFSSSQRNSIGSSEIRQSSSTDQSTDEITERDFIQAISRLCREKPHWLSPGFCK
jgi:hypothetical protein